MSNLKLKYIGATLILGGLSTVVLLGCGGEHGGGESSNPLAAVDGVQSLEQSSSTKTTSSNTTTTSTNTKIHFDQITLVEEVSLTEECPGTECPESEAMAYVEGVGHVGSSGGPDEDLNLNFKMSLHLARTCFATLAAALAKNDQVNIEGLATISEGETGGSGGSDPGSGGSGPAAPASTATGANTSSLTTSSPVVPPPPPPPVDLTDIVFTSISSCRDVGPSRLHIPPPPPPPPPPGSCSGSPGSGAPGAPGAPGVPVPACVPN